MNDLVRPEDILRAAINDWVSRIPVMDALEKIRSRIAIRRHKVFTVVLVKDDDADEEFPIERIEIILEATDDDDAEEIAGRITDAINRVWRPKKNLVIEDIEDEYQEENEDASERE